MKKDHAVIMSIVNSVSMEAVRVSCITDTTMWITIEFHRHNTDTLRKRLLDHRCRHPLPLVVPVDVICPQIPES